jgi:hypothetical protein
MSDLIYEVKKNIPSELCKQIIQRFEEDSNKFTGKTTNGIEKHIKNTTDLYIKGGKWTDIEEILHKQLNSGLREYLEYVYQYSDHYIDYFSTDDFELFDTGYQMQRYLPDGHFDWHTDYDIKETRLIAYIWYLNDVDKKDGGSTEFYNGKKIQPKEGMLLFFPTTWIHYHRGCELLKGYKYIITGFIKGRYRNQPNNSFKG